MTNPTKRLLRSCVMLCSVFGLVAYAAEPLSTTLAVHRIVKQDGIETSAPAATAKPGDELEYVVSYRNEGNSAVRDLTATLPLPVGTEFVPGSQHPADVQASLDGKTYAPLPLKRRVQDADGRLREELVPSREYRFLRWPPNALQPHTDLSVAARVTVVAATTPGAEPLPTVTK